MDPPNQEICKCQPKRIMNITISEVYSQAKDVEKGKFNHRKYTSLVNNQRRNFLGKSLQRYRAEIWYGGGTTWRPRQERLHEVQEFCHEGDYIGLLRQMCYLMACVLSPILLTSEYNIWRWHYY